MSDLAKEQSAEIEPKIKILSRDERGLIVGINYKYNDSGIDWKKMIPREYLYVNPDEKKRRQIEEYYKKKYEQIDVIEDNVRDSDLVILLAGLKYLLKLRGYKSISYNIKEASETFAAVNCKIVFTPNYESFNQEISHEDNASASLNNTNSFAKLYLLEICTNRALARCIRSFLNISVVSREELFDNILGPSAPIDKKTPINVRAIKMLRDIMEKKGVSEQILIEKISSEGGCAKTAKIEDLESEIVLSFIERLKKYIPPT